jgi:flagellar biosynthetic protein FliR
MSLAGLFMSKAALFALAASRIAGFVVVSPFPGKNVGTTQRIGLVVVLAWIVCAVAPGPAGPGPSLELVFAAVPELGCGLLIGMAFRFVYAGAEVLGGVIGHMTGLGSASVLNPTLDAPETPIARVLELTAMLVALSMGVHRVALAGLLESFRAIPVGSTIALANPALRYLDLAVDSFVIGVRLAVPVLAVALVVHVALAMISRAAPTLQIFSVGFAIVFAATGATLIASTGDVFRGLADHFAPLASAIDLVLTDLRP